MHGESTLSYYAHGKLLLSGEYLVLSGAKALAIPLKFGQSLKVYSHQKNYFKWVATHINGHWFEVEFDDNLNIILTDNLELAKKLSLILQKCINYRDDIKTIISNSLAVTKLEFNPNWGWGSSSTLISLLSQWLGINPYLLLGETFGGSGYDIACATANSAIIYQLVDNVPKISPVDFNPPFKENIWLIYSGNKQSSKHEIKRFSKLRVRDASIEQINYLTDEMLNSKNIKHFGEMMEQHERIISQIVQLNAVKDEHFKEFEGYIKTLGAWGGDFMMVISEEPENYIRTYFKDKGLTSIFKLNDIKANQ
ncbi:hypothetical protein J1N10_06340 [Carboxylicivirga sp. A043]|uniref:GYDIA family GHMP kinase n=1 Tax=Carboxylicivirga litoralis TaxID=2816963 RepID=UPI0021CAE842|nr:GYDIA family GHMP kinase [Carboxylicivirga sp. A043]MCU4155588.1 hypothetical protein [Carboxylicivirga sp. A043]